MILVAVPLYHNRLESISSIYKTCSSLKYAANEIYFIPKFQNEQWNILNIIKKRNMAIMKAREFIDCTHLIFFDDDMIIPENAIGLLIESCQDKYIVCGITPPRKRLGVDYKNLETPKTVAHYFARQPNGQLHELHQNGKTYRPIVRVIDKLATKPLNKIDFAGMGCTIIPRCIFEKIRFKATTDINISPDGSYWGMGEDGKYCLDAAREGFEIYENYNIQCDHLIGHHLGD